MEFNNEPKLSSADWEALRELRHWFLSEEVNSGRNYWDSSKILDLYHLTFAQRIGWKWDAVLAQLRDTLLLSSTSRFALLDYGCGTGIASEKVIEMVGVGRISQLNLWDQSRKACEFSQTRLAKRFPTLLVKESSDLQVPQEPWILCISHLLSEIRESQLSQIISLAKKAHFVIWVEPGTSELSRKLVGVRSQLLSEMSVVAPCNHQNQCGMMAEQNQKHWCHFFASPPGQVFQSAFWREFSLKLKIDLRSLPTSYLILQRKQESLVRPSPLSKVIGRPRIYKGYGKFLLCNGEGVREIQLLEKNQKTLFKSLKKEPFDQEVELSEC